MKTFLLSPAFPGGKRAQMLLNEQAKFELALKLRNGGATLGEVFQFLSGLYFRGKLAYCAAFADASFVITSGSGLQSPDTPVTLDDLRALASVPIDAADERYRLPLERDARRLAETSSADSVFVLLGSVASPKYVDILCSIFGGRLHFPSEFVGRGDMSRGGLMLRCARERSELTYVPVLGTKLRGARPPRLKPVR